MYRTLTELAQQSPTGLFLTPEGVINYNNVDDPTLNHYFSQAQIWQTMPENTYNEFVDKNPLYRMIVALNVAQSPKLNDILMSYMYEPKTIIDDYHAFLNQLSAEEAAEREDLALRRSAFARNWLVGISLYTVPLLYINNSLDAQQVYDVINVIGAEVQDETHGKLVDEFLKFVSERTQLEETIPVSVRKIFTFAYPDVSEDALEHLSNFEQYAFVEHYNENSAVKFPEPVMQFRPSGADLDDMQSLASAVIDIIDPKSVEFFSEYFDSFKPVEVLARLRNVVLEESLHDELRKMALDNTVIGLPVFADEYLHAYVHGDEALGDTIQHLLIEINNWQNTNGLMSMFVHNVFQLLDEAVTEVIEETGETQFRVIGHTISEEDFYIFTNRVLRRCTQLALTTMIKDEIIDEMDIFATVIPLEMLISRPEITLDDLTDEQREAATQVVCNYVMDENGLNDENVGRLATALVDGNYIMTEEDGKRFDALLEEFTGESLKPHPTEHVTE